MSDAIIVEQAPDGEPFSYRFFSPGGRLLATWIPSLSETVTLHDRNHPWRPDVNRMEPKSLSAKFAKSTRDTGAAPREAAS